MGYIDGFEDVMAMETGFLQYTMGFWQGLQKELDMLGVKLPDVSGFRQCGLTRQGVWQRNTTGRSATIRSGAGGGSSDRTVFQEEYDSDFVIVTHYPSKKRPFYAMDDPADPNSH